MAEQRVISPGGQKIRASGTKPVAPAKVAAPPVAEEAPRRRRMWLPVLILVALLAVAAAGFVYLREEPAATAAATEPEPGVVVPVEAVSVNLSDGRYLRLGFSIQLTAESHGEVETARASDIAIALYSGRSMQEVNDPAERTALKASLTQQLNDAFEGEVMAVYFTDFVTQ